MEMSWEDLIRSELEGMVPYAPGLRASEVRERSGKSLILKLSSNEHPCGPFPAAVAALEAVAPHLNRYPDGASRALRARLAATLAVGEEELVIGSGSNEILRLVAQVVLRPGDEVVFSWPSFVVYPMVAATFGATAVKVPLDASDTHDLEAMLAAITERTRLVYLCNPNNPTGSWYQAAAFRQFMKEVPPHVLVVADEAYFEFVTDPEYPDSLEWFDGERPLVVTRTFSKMYSLAGARVGYGVMPKTLAEAVAKVREPFNVTMPAQAAAFHSLSDPDEVVRRRTENAALRESLRDVCDELGIESVPSQTNFVYIKTSRPREVFEALLDEGVIVRDFGEAPALRIGVGTPSDMEVLFEALRAVDERLQGIGAAT